MACSLPTSFDQQPSIGPDSESSSTTSSLSPPAPPHPLFPPPTLFSAYTWFNGLRRYIVIFYAHVVFAHNIFGVRVGDFQDYYKTVRTLMLMTCGVINYAPMQEANKFWAPLYVMVFYIQMSVIMSKVYMVIINHEYIKVYEHERIFNKPDPR
jgi:hypothetical protein